MSISPPTPATPDPFGDDVARGLADLEHYVANQAPSPSPVLPAAAAAAPAEEGETRRVRELRAQVAEARLLADLQSDDTPLLLDTSKVRRQRQAAHEAARLHELAQDPAMRAWQAARVRRLLVAGAMVCLTLALSWSTAGVQKFAAGDAAAWSPGWVFAWFVEPFVSLALLVVVGARAYLAIQGRPLTHPTLVRIEWLFLLMSLGMNAWPYLPWSLAAGETFKVAHLVIHLIGPVIAVTVVMALPIILAGFTALDHTRPTGAPTGPTYRANTLPHGGGRDEAGSPGRAADLAPWVAEARRLITAGQLPQAPSATRIQRVLRCGMDTARAVRDELGGGA